MEISFDLTGDRRVGLRFEQFPENARAALQRRIVELTNKLLAEVRAAEPVASGRLRAETVEVIYDGKDRITGRVRIDAGKGTAARREYGKAAALEYGAYAATKVKEHMMSLDHFWSQAVSRREVLVSEYTRTPDIRAHAFLRGPAEAMRAEILASLREGLAEAEAQANA